jgi:hypothetical protein
MKKILVILGVIVLAVAAGLYYVFSNLDSIVKDQIESIGTSTLGSAVNAQDVKIKLLDGLGEITGFSVANPEGFKAATAMGFGTVRLDISTENIGQMPIVIDEILVDSLNALYELNSQGQGNLNVLLNQVAKGAGKEKPAEPTTESDAGTGDVRISVNKITVKDTSLALDLTALGQEVYDETLPTFSASNIGGDSGLPPAQLGQEIGRVMMTNIVNEAKVRQEEKLKGKVKDKTIEKLEEELGDKLDGEVGNTVRGLLNSI